MCGIIGYVGCSDPAGTSSFKACASLEYAATIRRPLPSSGMDSSNWFTSVRGTCDNLENADPPTGCVALVPWVSLTRGGPRTDGRPPRTAPSPHGLHRAFRDRPPTACGELP